MSDVFLARQPICDERQAVVGYELLYRSGPENRAAFVDGDLATATVAVNTLLEIGLDRLVGRRRAYVNMTRRFLVEGHYRTLPPGRVVIELLENLEVDAELIAAVDQARRLGYRIALDDVTGLERIEPLLDRVDVVKADVRAASPEQMAALARRLKGTGVSLLAEKVESFDEFESCRALGYRLFQGYFFCKPRIVRRQGVPADRMSLLRTMARIQSPSTSFQEIEELVACNASLSFKLLRSVNSALFSLPRNVDSVHQALVLLGLEKIRACVTLLLMSQIDDKPRELLVTGLIRARLCQSLGARRSGVEDPMFFTVGLFSVLDALADRPLEELLGEVPLSEDVRRALLLHEGPAGAALASALERERAPAGGSGESADPWSADEIQAAWLEALEFAASGGDLLGPA